MTGRYRQDEILVRIQELIALVGIDERMMHAYPHELDGGRRQRVGIARALAMDPKFIVCDEPVSALDVSIQAQVLNLLSDLQDQYGLTYMFVTHDMSVVRHISDQICVMYLGQAVEACASEELFQKPLHPYTKALLSVIPVPEIRREHKRVILEGEIVSPIDPKPGCRFAARCKYVTEQCRQPQSLQEVLPGHYVILSNHLRRQLSAGHKQRHGLAGDTVHLCRSGDRGHSGLAPGAGYFRPDSTGKCEEVAHE